MESRTPAEKPLIVILSGDKGLSDLPDALWSSGNDSAVASTWQEALQTIERSPNCLALVDADLPDKELSRIWVELPTAHVKGVLWLIAAGSNPQRYLSAPEGAVADTVTKPATTEELLYRLMAMLVRSGGSSAASARWTGHSGGLQERRGDIVAVFSTKGGVGKSLVAVNTAVGLARLYDENVLLVDADLYFGDVLALLDATTQYTIADICSRQMRDTDSLIAATLKHPTGISILARPPALERVDTLDRDQLIGALAVYRRLFDHIIINMSTSLDEFNLSLLDIAQRTLLITTPEIPAIQNTGRFVEIAERLGFLDKASFVLNRADSGVEKRQLEQRLGVEFATTIRSAGRLVVRAANEGTSLFVKDARVREDITRDLASVVELVAGRARPGAALSSRFPSLRRHAA